MVFSERVSALPFQIAVFLGAFLLFLIQPLIARQILPWFGGGSAIWSSCLLFFQVALVGGYAYAHLSRRLGPKRQVGLHLALLVLALATLPITPSPRLKPPDGEALVGRVLALLSVAVGVPYVLLAATAPMLQDWHARVLPDRSPYRLYVLSNVGSLAALLSYPVAVEPFLPMRSQSVLWSIAFGLFVVACGWCALRVRQVRAGPEPAPAGRPGTTERAGVVDRILWVALPAIGSGLLLACTSLLTQDIASVPLLWIVPLSIYLLTFILAFAGWYSRPVLAALFLISLGLAALLVRGDDSSASVSVQSTILLAALATACLVCHGELARLRPPVRSLTAYYLAIATGGGLGGVLVALAAPLLFTSYLELPLFFLVAVAALLAVMCRDVAKQHPGDVAILVSAGCTAAVAVALILILQRPDKPGLVARGRSFYGVLSVVDDTPGPRQLRTLYHGQIMHGSQFIASAFVKREATSYYSEGSGIEMGIRQHWRRKRSEPMKVGVVGLGTGSIAVWSAPFDRFRFFEIDPLVLDFSRRYFTYLEDAPGKVEIVPGDARLSLEREMLSEQNRHSYDLIALDAFSGDAIPVHLLTREAFALYLEALRPDGILAVHTSNRYLDLRPVVHGAAADLGLRVLEVRQPSHAAKRAVGNSWLLVTANEEFVSGIRLTAEPELDEPPTIVWTDSFSSLVSILR